MREMKDSGNFYIKGIPCNWEFYRLQDLILELPKSKIQASDGNNEGLYPFYTSSQELTKRTNICLYPSNSITMATGGIASVNFSKEPFSTSTDCLNFQTKQETRFVFYWLFSIKDTIINDLWFNGMGLKHLQKNDLYKSHIYLPKKSEQFKIANYLEKKCSEINEISETIEEQIEVLEDYKKSVISEAVTKGLNPNVEMKYSGMRWIGFVPSHWKIDKIKFHLKRFEYRNPGNMQVLSVYREYGVIPKDSRDDNHNVTSEDTSKYKHVKPGYFVINKMKAWQGSMGISDYEGVVSPAYFIYVFVDNLFIKKYIHYLLRSDYKNEFRRLSGGIREGQWDLSPLGFENTLILIPPKDEQDKIVKYIDKKCSEIDSIIEDKKLQLETIENYKKSLIYEYVTGKKEVPAND